MDGGGPRALRTTCAYCGVGCGVLATPDGNGGLTIAGDTAHPANAGRLCSKGAALGETVSTEGRLLRPVVQGTQTDWDTALDLVATRFRNTIAEHGPDSVAFYVSGQLLTEDYYVANKLMKGFIGSANIDTNSRLCMASTVAGHRRAFGTDTVPGVYEDLDEADTIVLVGSNLAWCHPILMGRIARAREARPELKLIVIDPRRTATAELADLHLAIAPGGDVALFNHLLCAIADQGAVDAAFVSNHVSGYPEALAAAGRSDVGQTGLSRAELHCFVEAWLRHEKVVTVFSQGVNQSSSGTDKVNAILNCHLATGRIGRVGMGPFSVTGQPNAMGGREVGGLANTLACHMDLEDPAHRMAVKTFWDAPAMPSAAGLKAVDMFRAVEDGQIKALWIICTNPAVSMPDADRVARAIKSCDFTVVSDMFARTDTAVLADVILPATGWAEKDGTVTNSDRTISRQRAVLPPPGEARADWAILAEFGRRMGWGPAFDYASPADIFREHAALSGIAGGFGKDFDISALRDLSDAEYHRLEPFRWPFTETRKGGRFFGDGQFFTPDSRARMLPLTVQAVHAKLTPAHPFRLNTGRNRDHWHTMTRTGRSARLSQHLAEPYLDLHPQDAAQLGVMPDSLVRVENDYGHALLRARITDAQRLGEVFAPMHWTADFAASARIDVLVPSIVDPVSGQPESKAAAVSVTVYPAQWFGFAVSTRDLVPDTPYWARARASGGWRAELAGTEPPENWTDWFRILAQSPQSHITEVHDPKRGLHRIALTEDGRLVAALFVAAEPVMLARNHLAGLLGHTDAMPLSGRPSGYHTDPGPTLCACLNVGINTIATAIETQQLLSLQAIGDALGAGTSCGSCRPEIAALIAARQPLRAAE